MTLLFSTDPTHDAIVEITVRASSPGALSFLLEDIAPQSEALPVALEEKLLSALDAIFKNLNFHLSKSFLNKL